MNAYALFWRNYLLFVICCYFLQYCILLLWLCCRDVTWSRLRLVEPGWITRCWLGIRLALSLCPTLSYSASHQTSPGSTKSWSVLACLCLSGGFLSVCASDCLSAWMWVAVCRSVLVFTPPCLWVTDGLSVSFLSLSVSHGLVGSQLQHIALQNYWQALLQIMRKELVCLGLLKMLFFKKAIVRGKWSISPLYLPI